MFLVLIESFCKTLSLVITNPNNFIDHLIYLHFVSYPKIKSSKHMKVELTLSQIVIKLQKIPPFSTCYVMSLKVIKKDTFTIDENL